MTAILRETAAENLRLFKVHVMAQTDKSGRRQWEREQRNLAGLD